PGIAMLRLRPTDDELWETLRADAAAAGAWEQLVEQASDIAQAAGPTRDAAAELLRQMERWQELATVLHAASTEADDPARAVMHMLEEAALHENQLADESSAITAYEAVLAIDPDAHDGIAARALERLYEKQNRWADLARLLERRALQSPPPDAIALRRRRAEILAEKLEALDDAAEELELLSANGAEGADGGLLDLLERVYKRADRQDDYLRTLARQADAAANPVERLAILRRLASEGEARQPEDGGADRAAEALEQILRIEPRDAEAYAALERIYRTTERPAALAAAMNRRLAVTETIEGQRELLSSLAETYERELDEWEPALDAYSRAEVAGDVRPETYAAIDRLAERLGKWDVATEAARKWAEIAPQDGGALAAGARVRRHNGDFEGALGLFLDAAERETTGSAQAALLTEAALIVQGGVGAQGQNHGQNREEQAVELYVRALASDS